MKKIYQFFFFLSEYFQFLEVKFSIYLNRHKKGKRKTRECHNHKPQPFPDSKRKKKQTKRNKHKSNKRTKSSKISSLSSTSEVIAMLKGLKKHKKKIIQGKTYNKSPRIINTKQQRVRLYVFVMILIRLCEYTI